MAGVWRSVIIPAVSILIGVVSLFQGVPVRAAERPGWQAEWERVLTAARKEGKVVVFGPPGAAARKALTEGFQKSFAGIEVEYSGMTGSKASPRLLAERRAGSYLVDVHVGGTGTMLQSLLPAGALDPIEPVLILPEVIDPKKWWQGKLEFADTAGKYNLIFTTNVRTHVAVNPKLVKRDELKSYWDFLNPKWRAKIVMDDPTLSGPGQGTAKFFLIHPTLGREFIRRLFTEQKVTLVRNERQLLEWIVRGDYLIAISPSELNTNDLTAKGLPIELVRSDQFKEGSTLNAGFGSVARMNRAPHPNAARVYLNWLLSKDGQTEWSRGSGYPSRRLDVPRDHVSPESLPREGKSYLPTYKEEYFRYNDEVEAFIRELLKR
jgi:ABC-type Fe3+ transport system substrate-binding protein